MKQIFRKNQKHLIDENICLADIALFPFIRQCAHVDLNWFQNNFKNLFAWLEDFKTSDLFSSIMIKYEIWSSGDKNLIIENE